MKILRNIQIYSWFLSMAWMVEKSSMGGGKTEHGRWKRVAWAVVKQSMGGGKDLDGWGKTGRRA